MNRRYEIKCFYSCATIKCKKKIGWYTMQVYILMCKSIFLLLQMQKNT